MDVRSIIFLFLVSFGDFSIWSFKSRKSSFDVRMEMITATSSHFTVGGLAQMVERSLSMREVPGSIPGFSTCEVIYFSFENQKLNTPKIPKENNHCLFY